MVHLHLRSAKGLQSKLVYVCKEYDNLVKDRSLFEKNELESSWPFHHLRARKINRSCHPPPMNIVSFLCRLNFFICPFDVDTECHPSPTTIFSLLCRLNFLACPMPNKDKLERFFTLQKQTRNKPPFKLQVDRVPFPPTHQDSALVLTHCGLYGWSSVP